MESGYPRPLPQRAVTSHEGKHTPGDFHRQLVWAVAQLADAAQAVVVRPVWDKHGCTGPPSRCKEPSQRMP
jgi:hypothetical protein